MKRRSSDRRRVVPTTTEQQPVEDMKPPPRGGLGALGGSLAASQSKALRAPRGELRGLSCTLRGCESSSSEALMLGRGAVRRCRGAVRRGRGAASGCESSSSEGLMLGRGRRRRKPVVVLQPANHELVHRPEGTGYMEYVEYGGVGRCKGCPGGPIGGGPADGSANGSANGGITSGHQVLLKARRNGVPLLLRGGARGVTGFLDQCRPEGVNCLFGAEDLANALATGQTYQVVRSVDRDVMPSRGNDALDRVLRRALADYLPHFPSGETQMELHRLCRSEQEQFGPIMFGGGVGSPLHLDGRGTLGAAGVLMRGTKLRDVT